MNGMNIYRNSEMMYTMMAMDIPSGTIKCEKVTDDGQICGGKLEFKYSDEEHDFYKCLKCREWSFFEHKEGE